MILFVDFGNSNFKWCFSANENIGEVQFFQYSIESINSLLTSNLLSEKKIYNVENVFVCCVAQENMKSVFSSWVMTNLGQTPIYCESSDKELGVRNSYSEASKLGNDRWLTLLYVHHFYQSDVCIIDCGTAITVDVILKNGQHKGGLIAPGYSSQISALKLKTNIIDNQNFTNQKNSTLLQNDTHQSIEQGCRIMSLGFIKYVVEQLKNQYGDTMTVVITGGDSESFVKELPATWHYSRDLLFRALLFYSMQQKWVE